MKMPKFATNQAVSAATGTVTATQAAQSKNNAVVPMRILNICEGLKDDRGQQLYHVLLANGTSVTLAEDQLK